MSRIALSFSLLVVACLLFVISVCGQPADLQHEQDATLDIRATVVAEITATAAAIHVVPPSPTTVANLEVPPGSFVSPVPLTPDNTPVEIPTPTAISRLNVPPGSFVSPVPLISDNVPVEVPTSTPRPIKTPTLASIVEYISPSVVQIETASGVSGTGFIVDSDGLILTNAHVVENFSTVDVRVGARLSYPGEVLGVDEVADLALIKVNIMFPILRAVTLDDSDEIVVGEDVIAMGFPAVGTLGSTPTITRGIISAKRSLDSGVTLLQTDAAINPGNSGGPLLRPNGQVVGVNTSKIFKSDDGRPLEGIGMAISVNDVRSRLDSLARGESVLLDKPPSFGTLELATVLDDFLPRSFEGLDPATEGLAIYDLGLDYYFSDLNLVVYASAEPFQMIMAATGELSDLERISLQYELSDTEVFLDEVRKSALSEVQVTDPDADIDDYGLLNLRQVGDVSGAIWMNMTFDEISLRAEMIIFLRNNHVGMVWIYYFPDTEPSAFLDDVAEAIAEAMTERVE